MVLFACSQASRGAWENVIKKQLSQILLPCLIAWCVKNTKQSEELISVKPWLFHAHTWVHKHNVRQHNKHWPTHRSSREVSEERLQTASPNSLAETIITRALFTLQAALKVADCFEPHESDWKMCLLNGSRPALCSVGAYKKTFIYDVVAQPHNHTTHTHNYINILLFKVKGKNSDMNMPPHTHYTPGGLCAIIKWTIWHMPLYIETLKIWRLTNTQSK